jgi:lipopolysaccharide export system protein LptA
MGNAEVDHMEAEGKVYIKQGEQVATGDHGTFDMQSGVLVLTGKEVVLTEGENVVVGCKLVSNTKSGLSKLDGCGRGGGEGRIKMLLQPGSQSTN